MLAFDFETLCALGLTPMLASRAMAIATDEPSDMQPSQLVRVTEVHRETLVVHDGCGESSARALPRLVRALFSEGSAIAVGDWVFSFVDAYRQRWLTRRVPPTSHIARRDGDSRLHAIVSNVDVALLLMGLDDDFNPRRLERFLALVDSEAVVPVAVLTKADIVAHAPNTLAERVAALRARLPSSVDIHAVNATHASAGEALREYCARGRTLVLLGSSGSGKSTLTNTLLGAHVQDTGAVREHDSRGKHTTTSRSLHRLPSGACVIDTPGLRTLRPDGDESAIARSFADIDDLASQCRFNDCRHEHEPGCAVREGVDGDRLRNYQKMLRELRRETLTPLDRQRQIAQWKVRGRAVRERMKWKRGGDGRS